MECKPLDEPDVNVDSLLRSVTVQSLLSIGSRSFSHFLNAIERYLPLLRNLAAGGISAPSTTGVNNSARTDIMSAVAAVWKRSRHMILIVFDKLMQYQIVDPTDVVAWTFTHCTAVTQGVNNKQQLDAGSQFKGYSASFWSLVAMDGIMIIITLLFVHD